MRRHYSLFIALIIFVLLTLTYGLGVIRNEFVLFDDNTLITQNTAVQEFSWRSVRYVFTSYDPELYIPLTLVSYQINHAVAGLSAPAFHAVNLFLHGINAFLVFLLVRRLIGSRNAGIATALLFALHPLRTEAVLWASARKDLLSATFFLAAFLAFLHYRTTEHRRWFAASLILFFCALLSKVTVAILPLLLLLADWVHGHRFSRRAAMESASFFILSAAFGIVALGGKTAVLGAPTAWQTLLLAAKAYVFYLGKIFWPADLAVAYAQRTPVTITALEFIIPSLILLALIGVAVILFLRGKLRLVAFAIAFFLIAAGPSALNTMKNGFLFFASDRYAYLASIGPLLPVGIAFEWGMRRWRFPVLLCFFCSFCILCFLSYRQSFVWRTTATLFEHVLRIDPSSALAENNIAATHDVAGDDEEALKGYRRAVALEPGYVRAHLNIANIHRDAGKQDEAMAAYQAAVHAVGTTMPVTPEALNAYFEYGQFLQMRGQQEEAYVQFQKATTWNLSHGEAFYNLGVVAHGIGRDAEAFTALQTSVRYSPHFVPALYLLAGFEAERGMLADAEAHLRAVTRLAPGYEQAEEHLRQIRAMRAR